MEQLSYTGMAPCSVEAVARCSPWRIQWTALFVGSIEVGRFACSLESPNTLTMAHAGSALQSRACVLSRSHAYIRQVTARPALPAATLLPLTRAWAQPAVQRGPLHDARHSNAPRTSPRGPSVRCRLASC